MDSFEQLICPVCHRPLNHADKSLVCPLGHSYDIAGKGYVNLLLSRDKNSKDPGDNKEMAKARKSFLDKGYYEPLSERLCDLFSHMLITAPNDAILLDAGCGDGYYTDKIHRTFAESPANYRMFGMDISKEAIRLASGRNKDIAFFVASLFKIPFETNRADFVLNAFAPAHDEEFNRILKKNGVLVTIIPGKKHLFEFKSVLYDNNTYENDEKEPELPSFMLEEQVRISGFIKINSREDIADLLTMTPYYWRTPKAGIERLKKLDSLETEIEFLINIHSKIL